jgi:prepilin-type N-terminal cleavage/methylation domain-containing protein/prepilin-type processing-associated H-X9-DG protein
MPTPANQPRRDGFTFVELLVVIAVIGILVSLLLPAIQQIREAARRTECSNHIRQLSLGMMNYESSLKRLPTGWQVTDDSDPLAGPGWGWAYYLLPYLEQQSLFDQIDPRVSVDDHQHEDLLRELVPVFQCASDPADNLLDLNEAVHGSHAHALRANPLHDPPVAHDEHWIARSNYSGVFGSNEIEDNPMEGNGIFFGNSHLHLRDIGDGLSNTILVGERRNDFGHLSWAGVFPDVDEPFARVVGSADHPPNDPDGHFEDFRSFHPQGANFTFADGSTRMINETVDAAVFQALATRDNGEINLLVD